MRGEFGRVIYWLQTLRSWKRWAHQKSTLKDSMQRKYISQRKWRISFSNRRWMNQTFWRRSGTENTHLDTGTPNSWRKSQRDFLGEAEGSLPLPHDSFPDAGEAINDFWSMSRNFIYRHHVFPRVKLYLVREESVLIPLKYIDVSRTTHTNLDVMQESRIGDCWQSMDQEICLILGQVSLSLLFLKRNLQTEKCGLGGKVTSRPDHLWPGLWIKLGRNAKLREMQKLSTEKPKLDNARRFRGICVLDPEDKEFKETIENARKKLETPMAPAMLCKTSKKCKHGETRGKTNEFKSKLACILEASESTRLRMEESLPNCHEDHIAGKLDNSLQHIHLVHTFLPMPQAMKIPAAKAAVDKEWEKLGKDFGVELDKTQK